MAITGKISRARPNNFLKLFTDESNISNAINSALEDDHITIHAGKYTNSDFMAVNGRDDVFVTILPGADVQANTSIDPNTAIGGTEFPQYPLFDINGFDTTNIADLGLLDHENFRERVHFHLENKEEWRLKDVYVESLYAAYDDNNPILTVNDSPDVPGANPDTGTPSNNRRGQVPGEVVIQRLRATHDVDLFSVNLSDNGLVEAENLYMSHDGQRLVRVNDSDQGKVELRNIYVDHDVDQILTVNDNDDNRTVIQELESTHDFELFHVNIDENERVIADNFYVGFDDSDPILTVNDTTIPSSSDTYRDQVSGEVVIERLRANHDTNLFSVNISDNGQVRSENLYITHDNYEFFTINDGGNERVKIDYLGDDEVVVSITSDGEVNSYSSLTFDGTLLSLTGNQQITGTLDVDSQTTLASLNVEDLTEDRLVFVGSGGELEDSSDLTFDDSTFTVEVDQEISGTLDVDSQTTLDSVNVEDLDENGIVYVSNSSGELETNVSNFSFDGSTVTINSSLNLDNIVIDGNTITTSTGNLILDSNGGLIETPQDLTVQGDFTVNGTTTTINTATLNVEDNNILLNSNVTSPSGDAGIEVNRGSSDNVEVYWDESDSVWRFSDLTIDSPYVIASESYVDAISSTVSEGTLIDILPVGNDSEISHGTPSNVASDTDAGSNGFIRALTFDGLGHVGSVTTDTFSAGTGINLSSGNQLSIDLIGGTGINLSSGNEFSIDLNGGTRINVLGNTISHTGPGSQSATFGNPGGGRVIEEIQVDSTNHVTGVSVIDLDGRYDDYGYWTITANNGGFEQITSTESVDFIGIGNIDTTRTSSGIEIEFTGSATSEVLISSEDSNTKADAQTWGVEVFGDLRASGDVIANYSSDINLKKDLQVIDDPIYIINGISGYSFTWKENYKALAGQKDYGIIAQELKQVLPESVTERENGTLAVDYIDLIPVLIEAVKEQQKEIEELKSKVSN